MEFPSDPRSNAQWRQWVFDFNAPWHLRILSAIYNPSSPCDARHPYLYHPSAGVGSTIFIIGTGLCTGRYYEEFTPHLRDIGTYLVPPRLRYQSYRNE